MTQAEENKKRAMDEGADVENAPESHDEEE